jgi:hypothetical protein
MINVVKDKPNSQIHHLYLKQDSVVKDRLDQIEEATRSYFLNQSMLFEYVRIFRELSYVYTILSTFIRPLEVQNRKELDLLVSLVFKRLIDIQLKMAEVISGVSPLIQCSNTQCREDDIVNFTSIKESDIIRSMSRDFSSWKSLEDKLKFFKDSDSGKETVPVLKLLYNATHQIKVHLERINNH